MEAQNILFMILLCLQYEIIYCQRRQNNMVPANKERGMPMRMPHRKQVLMEESFVPPCMPILPMEQMPTPKNYATQPNIIYQPNPGYQQTIIEASPKMIEVMPQMMSNMPMAPQALQMAMPPQTLQMAMPPQTLQMAMPPQTLQMAMPPQTIQVPMQPMMPAMQQPTQMPIPPQPAMPQQYQQMPMVMPIQQEIITAPVPYMPVAVAEARVPEPPNALVSPFLPAASPVSAWAPPTSNLLPPMSASKSRSHFLRKIPIPPPSL